MPVTPSLVCLEVKVTIVTMISVIFNYISSFLIFSCHCQDGSVSSNGADNPSNLPNCPCGAGKSSLYG